MKSGREVKLLAPPAGAADAQFLRCHDDIHLDLRPGARAPRLAHRAAAANHTAARPAAARPRFGRSDLARPHALARPRARHQSRRGEPGVVGARVGVLLGVEPLLLPAARAQLAAALGGRPLVRLRRPQHGRLHVLRALQLLPAVGPGDARRVRQGERRPRQRGQGERRRLRAARGGAHRGAALPDLHLRARRPALLARRQGGARRLRAALPRRRRPRRRWRARVRLAQPAATPRPARRPMHHADAALDVSVRQARDHADEVRAAGGAQRAAALDRGVEHRQRRPRLHRRHALPRAIAPRRRRLPRLVPGASAAAAMPHHTRPLATLSSLTTCHAHPSR